MAFASRQVEKEVAEEFHKISFVYLGPGSSSSEDAVRSSRTSRFLFAREELWKTGGGSLNRDFDCTACKHSLVCRGECLRKN